MSRSTKEKHREWLLLAGLTEDGIRIALKWIEENAPGASNATDLSFTLRVATRKTSEVLFMKEFRRQNMSHEDILRLYNFLGERSIPYRREQHIVLILVTVRKRKRVLSLKRRAQLGINDRSNDALDQEHEEAKEKSRAAMKQLTLPPPSPPPPLKQEPIESPEPQNDIR